MRITLRVVNAFDSLLFLVSHAKTQFWAKYLVAVEVVCISQGRPILKRSYMFSWSRRLFHLFISVLAVSFCSTFRSSALFQALYTTQKALKHCCLRNLRDLNYRYPLALGRCTHFPMVSFKYSRFLHLVVVSSVLGAIDSGGSDLTSISTSALASSSLTPYLNITAFSGISCGGGTFTPDSSKRHDWPSWTMQQIPSCHLCTEQSH